MRRVAVGLAVIVCMCIAGVSYGKWTDKTQICAKISMADMNYDFSEEDGENGVYAEGEKGKRRPDSTVEKPLKGQLNISYPYDDIKNQGNKACVIKVCVKAENDHCVGLQTKSQNKLESIAVPIKGYRIREGKKEVLSKSYLKKHLPKMKYEVHYELEEMRGEEGRYILCMRVKEEKHSRKKIKEWREEQSLTEDDGVFVEYHYEIPVVLVQQSGRGWQKELTVNAAVKVSVCTDEGEMP